MSDLQNLVGKKVRILQSRTNKHVGLIGKVKSIGAFDEVIVQFDVDPIPEPHHEQKPLRNVSISVRPEWIELIERRGQPKKSGTLILVPCRFDSQAEYDLVIAKLTITERAQVLVEAAKSKR